MAVCSLRERTEGLPHGRNGLPTQIRYAGLLHASDSTTALGRGARSWVRLPGKQVL